MLLFLLIPLFCIAGLAADLLHYVHLRRDGRRHSAFVILATFTDLLPFLSAVLGLLLKDNYTWYMMLSMWVVWCWMITVLPRMCYFVLRRLRMPRTGMAAAAVLAALLIWGATAGRTSIRVSRVEILSERIPEGFDGMRIVQISDLHIGTIIRPERELTRIVDSVNALRPELVLFAGDLVNIRSSELDGRIMRLLERIEAPVVSVTGNHDVGAYIRDTVAQPREESLAEVIRLQREMGWQVLEDTTVYLHRGGDSISLSGISFDPALRKRRHDADVGIDNPETVYRGVPPSLFNITVVHLPQLWDDITEFGYGDLTVAGHVHSMQMKIPVGRRGWSPAALLYKRWSGRYDERGRTLYINDGTGCVGFPMRLGARPEITLFILRRCA